MKQCSKCKELKDEGEFQFQKKRSSYRADCKECKNASIRTWYWKNHKEQVERIKANHIKNAEKECIHRKKVWCEGRSWNQQHPEAKKIIAKRYNQKHKKQLLDYQRKRFQNNPQARLARRICKAIWYSLKGRKGGAHWENLVRYNIDELKWHLEKQFTKGMSWDNYGKWHIDHIIPISFFQFNSADDIEFRMCWRLENLQPLWAEDNHKKHIKIA